MDIYVVLDNNYGDLKEYDEKYNTFLKRVEKTKKMYSLQEILDEYDSLYSEKEDLESQVGDLEEKIKELEETIESLKENKQ